MKHMTKRYYKLGETVFLKEEKTFGVIKALNINPEEKIYKAVVEFTNGDATITRTLDLWQITKDQRKKKVKYRKKFVLNVPIKYFDESLPQVEKIQVGNWIDLYAREDVTIDCLKSARIPLNVAMELPEGYEAHILPRSSTFNKWGIILANSQGIVDTSYKGDNDEWLFNAISLVEGGSVIKKGDRIAQFRIMREMPKTNFIPTKVLGNKDRGGFGTTGSN